ncbi:MULTISPECIES: hypothetical protein [Streptomyces]|uniref:Lipoprotein n=1 Tax=Streptomyces akebiae TaxID=2865673 RepID=A0ABX8XJZ1_9ACTN|nr:MULTISPECIES: hypothetical protein [Streptomyces]MCX5173779.1 hypothetical protein [Streptomyces antibioticus]QYX76089.1 hypothetical protein K1J60_05850 [Streptomyces akebiae]
MRRWTRAVPTAFGALALAVILTGCNDKDSAAARPSSASSTAQEQTTFRLGQASPVQESTMQDSAGATYRVTPTKVVTGTEADIDNSGLEKDAKDGPQVPVFVWSTLTHESGKAMRVGDMDDDLVIKTSSGQRTRALIVLLGQAKWPNCPSFDSDKKLAAGQSEQICTAFLIPKGQRASAVELTQGYYKEPLEWPVKS